MKHSKFTDNQIKDIPKWFNASLAVTNVCHELGISSDSFLSAVLNSTAWSLQ